MSGKIGFFIGGSLMRCHDAAIVLNDEDPLDQLVAAAIATISTSVMVTCGDVEMHLAAWQEPDQWSDDWTEKGIDPDDVAEFVAAQMESL